MLLWFLECNLYCWICRLELQKYVYHDYSMDKIKQYHFLLFVSKATVISIVLEVHSFWYVLNIAFLVSTVFSFVHIWTAELRLIWAVSSPELSCSPWLHDGCSSVVSLHECLHCQVHFPFPWPHSLRAAAGEAEFQSCHGGVSSSNLPTAQNRALTPNSASLPGTGQTQVAFESPQSPGDCSIHGQCTDIQQTWLFYTSLWLWAAHSTWMWMLSEHKINVK